MNITNFRDLGGYEVKEGLYIKKGIFYRSAVIQFETEEDRAEFESLHIKTILDLRSPQESQKTKDEVPEGCRYIQCSAVSTDNAYEGNFDMADLMKNGDLSKLVSYMEKVYKSVPFQNEAIRCMFALMKTGEIPVVFHCSAGKDRTGFLAYLILKTLGASDETAMYDYLLSNEYRKEENDKLLKLAGNSESAKAMIYVKEEYLQSAINAITERYGDFHTYIEKEYGIADEDVTFFRKQYLEKRTDV